MVTPRVGRPFEGAINRPFGLIGVTSTGPVALLGWIDGYLTEAHVRRVSTTEYPIESGAERTDHAVRQPDELQLEVWVSDVRPLPYIDEDNRYFRAPDVGVERPLAAWQEIGRLMSERTLLRVLTHFGVYENMIITNATARSNRTTGQGLRGTLTLKELLIGSLVRFDPTTTPVDPSIPEIETIPVGILSYGDLANFSNVWRGEDLQFRPSLMSPAGRNILINEYYYPFYRIFPTEPTPVIRDRPDRGLANARERFSHIRLTLTDDKIQQVVFKRIPIPDGQRLSGTVQLRRSSAYSPRSSRATAVQAVFVPRATPVPSDEFGPDVIENPPAQQIILSIRWTLNWNAIKGEWQFQYDHLPISELDREIITEVQGFQNNLSSLQGRGLVQPQIDPALGEFTTVRITPVTVGGKLINSPHFDEDIVVVPVVPDSNNITANGGLAGQQPLARDSFSENDYAMIWLTPGQGRHWTWPPMLETYDFREERRDEERSRPLR